MKRFLQNTIAFFTWLTGRVGSGPQDASELPPEAISELVPAILFDRDEATVDPTPAIFEPRDPEPHVQKYHWCIDNGHGSDTAGKRSPVLPDNRQFFEYEFNRDISAQVMAKLDELGVSYMNVVPETTDVSLYNRVSRANQETSSLPKIFLSIHSNSSTTGAWETRDIKGTESWFYGSSDNGKRLASAFQRHSIRLTGFRDRGIKYHSPTYKSFYVLRKTSMPAVLTESGFFTTQSECIQLLDPAVRAQIAQAHVDAIMDVERNGMEGIATYNKIVRIKK